MNDGDNRMVLGEIDDILYTEAYPVALAEKLCQAVERSDVNEHAKEMSDKYTGLSWEESYKKVEMIIRREVLNG